MTQYGAGSMCMWESKNYKVSLGPWQHKEKKKNTYETVDVEQMK